MNDKKDSQELTAEEIETLESKKTGRLVLLALIGFFVVFASVDAFFVYKALKSNSGTVVDNPYEMGLKYNEIIARSKELKENERKNQSDTSAQ